jgi:hypothetical protein
MESLKIEFESGKIINLSDAKEGDILLLRSDDVNVEVVQRIRRTLEAHLKRKLFVICVGTDDDAFLVDGSTELQKALMALAEEATETQNINVESRL